MKTLKNLKAFQLSKAQMNQLSGGVNAKEYCDTAHALYQANSQNWSPKTKTGFATGWNQAGCDRYYNDICF